MVRPSVVVDDFNVLGSACGPAEADPSLVIDPNRVLSLAVLLERFEPVCRRHLQGIQRDRRIQHSELASRHREYVVKSLAAQTAKATESITGQVGEIQTATRAALVAIRQIHRATTAVGGRASEIGSAMTQQKMATSEISRSTSQAATGARDVSENISAISDANVTASDMASAVSASAAEVANQAQGLRRDVEEFLRKVQAA
jgi:hypothetical protein